MPDPVTIAAVGWGISTAGWLVSPIISKLLNKCFSYLGPSPARKLKKLESKVLQLKLMLEAAETLPQRGELELWVKGLKSAFYEAEDILDAIDYQQLETRILSKIDDKSTASTNHKSALSCFGCKRKNFNVPIESKAKLKAIVNKIEKLINEGLKFLLLLNLPATCENINNISNNIVRSSTRRTQITSVPPSDVFGRDRDIEMIIRMLRDTPADGEPSSSRTKCFSVIGICGIPGSGKTTLAQCVFQKEREDDYFDHVMWIHVSNIFDVHTISTEMLEITSGRKREQLINLDMLQRELEEEIRGRRFFLVLDDVWYDKDPIQKQQLGQLLSPLKAGRMGSKVLVTTRNADAATSLGAQNPPVLISDLDEEDFFKMFMHHALDATNRDQAFQSVGREIAGKLGRLPLAASLVGGQLRIRPHIDFWRSSLNSDLLNDSMRALWWSYQQLEENVKKCFAYCSIFPRRRVLKRDELVHLWIAEGFVKTTDETEDVEGVGLRYFYDLLSTSFIQLKTKIGRAEFFTIHDLLHDLAESVAGSDIARFEKGVAPHIPQDTRHIFMESYDRTVFEEQILKLKTLRTLFISYSTESMTDIDFEHMLRNLKKLRVVRVSPPLSGTIPACIGELKHLRYLSFFGSHVLKMILPPTFTKLYNLQILSASEIRQLACANNEGLGYLENLRYITGWGFHFPDIGRLTSLRTLTNFTVGKIRGYEIQQLEHLDYLGDSLLIQGLQNIKSEAARQAKLVNKTRIKALELRWDAPDQYSSLMMENQNDQELNNSADPQEEVFEALLPPPYITSLKICNYRRSAYPGWLTGEQSPLTNLQNLVFKTCFGPSDEPPRLSESFRYLHTLIISTCNWKSLPENIECLTSLENLIVTDCWKIESLPRLPPSIKKFTLSNCNQSFTENCCAVGHPYCDIIDRIPETSIC